MTQTESTRKPPSPRDVQYDIRPLDDLPDRGVRTSVLEQALEQVKVQHEATGESRWHQIGSYRLGSAASAAANQLRKRHGKGPEVHGWRIATGKQDKDENGHPLPKADHRTILAVRYEPDKIVEDEMRAHEEHSLRQKDKARTKRQAKKSE